MGYSRENHCDNRAILAFVDLHRCWDDRGNYKHKRNLDKFVHFCTVKFQMFKKSCIKNKLYIESDIFPLHNN